MTTGIYEGQGTQGPITSEEAKRGIDATFIRNTELETENGELKARLAEKEVAIQELKADNQKFEEYRDLLTDPPDYMQVHLRTKRAVVGALKRCKEVYDKKGDVNAGGMDEKRLARRLLDGVITTCVEHGTSENEWRKIYQRHYSEKPRL